MAIFLLATRFHKHNNPIFQQNIYALQKYGSSICLHFISLVLLIH
jgi:hypothetical protein